METFDAVEEIGIPRVQSHFETISLKDKSDL